MLRVSLFQFAPDCRQVVSFRRRGHRGLNVIRLRVVTSGVRLRPGTYRITVRSPTRIVMRRRFVVARARPKDAALLAALGRDACAAARGHAQLISAPFAAPAVPTPPRGAVAGSHVVLHPGRGTTGRDVLGELTVLASTPSWLKPILIAVFGLALALLALAALPQSRVYPAGPAVLVARHRGGLAALGVTLLAGVALAILLT